jgi:hypothetical protein
LESLLDLREKLDEGVELLDGERYALRKDQD